MKTMMKAFAKVAGAAVSERLGQIDALSARLEALGKRGDKQVGAPP